MPQLVPFYFVNQLSFAFLIMAILIYIFSNYLLPLYPQLFLTRLAITKLSQKSPLFIRGWVFYFQNIGRFNPKIGATTTATATTITAQIQVRHYRVGIYPLSHLRLVLDWVGSRCGVATAWVAALFGRFCVWRWRSHCHTQTRPTRRPPHDSRGCMGGAFQPQTQESSYFDSRTDKHYSRISFYTLTSPVFTEFYDIFYLNGVKILPPNIGELLTARGLAYFLQFCPPWARVWTLGFVACVLFVYFFVYLYMCLYVL